MTMNADIAEAVRGRLATAEDNLYRARLAACRSDPSQQWGESGQTLQEIIDGYQADVERWKRALAEAI